ncbi:protein translocase subunit SecF [Alicyclobacillus kakegawensis]|uniref:protein translocase subunit SecF n=1 Tax=Alicyclobacillus kakegawensis TaxID=392012 RepID=UPI000835C5AB|nr:protein translocase subunit SecF [Alicyclobacillus kakegawensis]
MKVHFDIVRRRHWFFGLSLVITVIGLIVWATMGFNLGTDFKAGSRVQMDLGQPVNIAQVRSMMSDAGLPVGQDAITVAGANKQTAVVRFPQVLTQAQVATINRLEKQQFPHSQGAAISTVSPFVAQQTSRKAVWAVLLASLFIVAYLAVRFEYRFALAAIIALLHDAFIVISVFAMFRLEVDLTFVAAVLTIVGYSINDTIVIFDRIRENLKLTPPKTYHDLQQLVNRSLWQTMTRSINTVVTVLIAAVMLYLFGGQSIHNFTLALIVGLVSGAYSSIFIASPIWFVWRGRGLPRGEPEGVPGA